MIDGLKALRETFPNLPVSFSTEGLGGALQQLRRPTIRSQARSPTVG